VPAGALLSAASVVAPQAPSQPYAAAPARLQSLRLAAATLGAGATAGLIPSTLLGKTFVWDVPTHQYVVGTSAGPNNGVRVILYAVDPVTQQIVESPLTAVGYVDVIDQSTASINQLHVIVNAGTPAVITATYADYTVTGTVTRNGSGVATAFSASAVGFVSDGSGGHRLDFQASFAATNLDTTHPGAQVDVHWALNNPPVTVDLHETVASPDANDLTLTLDFTITHGSEAVRLAGTVTVVVSPQTVTADLTVSVNGAAFARITGTNGGIQIRHLDGSQLSAAELQALANLFGLPDQIQAAIVDLFHPAEHLMGA
jgi:hypothetical protein